MIEKNIFLTDFASSGGYCPKMIFMKEFHLFIFHGSSILLECNPIFCVIPPPMNYLIYDQKNAAWFHFNFHIFSKFSNKHNDILYTSKTGDCEIHHCQLEWQTSKHGQHIQQSR